MVNDIKRVSVVKKPNTKEKYCGYCRQFRKAGIFRYNRNRSTVCPEFICGECYEIERAEELASTSTDAEEDDVNFAFFRKRGVPATPGEPTSSLVLLTPAEGEEDIELTDMVTSTPEATEVAIIPNTVEGSVAVSFTPKEMLAVEELLATKVVECNRKSFTGIWIKHGGIASTEFSRKELLAFLNKVVPICDALRIWIKHDGPPPPIAEIDPPAASAAIVHPITGQPIASAAPTVPEAPSTYPFDDEFGASGYGG